MKLYLVVYVWRGTDMQATLFRDLEEAQNKFEEIKASGYEEGENTEEDNYNEEYDSLFIEEIEAPVEIRHLEAELGVAQSKICAAKAALGC